MCYLDEGYIPVVDRTHLDTNKGWVPHEEDVMASHEGSFGPYNRATKWTDSPYNKGLINLENLSRSNKKGDDMLVINVLEVIESNFCISYDDGEKLCDVINQLLSNGKNVSVSFGGIIHISPAFLESCIMGLYESGFSEDEVEERIVIDGLSDGEAFILERIKDRIHDFLKDPDRFEAIMGDVLGEYND